MNLHCYWRARLIRFIFFIPFFSMPLFSICAMEEVGMTLEQIQKPEVLREIAGTILGRVREKARLKEKLCKHGETMINVWKSGKKWGDLDEKLQGILTEHVPKSQVQSILRRDRHAVMSPEILAKPAEFAQTIVEKGMPVLQLMGQKKDEYGIKIFYDLSPKIGGVNFIKGDLGIKEIPETKIYISFSVTDIITKIMKGGLHAWNKEVDGEISTLCVDGD